MHWSYGSWSNKTQWMGHLSVASLWHCKSVRSWLLHCSTSHGCLVYLLMEMENVFCNNHVVVKNMSIPELTLMKRHNAINYHLVREVVAAKIIWVQKKMERQTVPICLWSHWWQKGDGTYVGTLWFDWTIDMDWRLIWFDGWIYISGTQYIADPSTMGEASLDDSVLSVHEDNGVWLLWMTIYVLF